MSSLSIAIRHMDVAARFLGRHPGLLLKYLERRNMIVVEKEHVLLHLKTVKNEASDPFNCFWGETLYRLIREHRPKVTIETGVYLGASSAFILQALKDNGSGQLYSIDIPGFTPRGVSIGHHVPDHLRTDSWQLILESSRTSLPRLLSVLDEVDIFIHDSDHSYDNMKFEYESAWPMTKILVSDDISHNGAYGEFLERHKAEIKSHLEIHHNEKHFAIVEKR